MTTNGASEATHRLLLVTDDDGGVIEAYVAERRFNTVHVRVQFGRFRALRVSTALIDAEQAESWQRWAASAATWGQLRLWEVHIPGGPALMTNTITALRVALDRLQPDPAGPIAGALSRLLEACEASEKKARDAGL